MIRLVLTLFACWLLVATPVAAGPLDVQVKNVRTNIRTPSSAVTATVELRDVLPDRFRKLVEDGAVLHLRVQTELWESRPVWDRLVYPAIVRVFRLGRTPAARTISITDASGAAPAPIPDPLPLIVDLGNSDRVTASERYYVHVVATLGTLADQEADAVGDAVFGRASETNALGSLGRLVFRTALQVNDYLQSVTAEAKSRRLSGRDVLAK